MKRLLELHNHNAVRVARALGLGPTGNSWVNKVARGELVMTDEKRNRVEYALRRSGLMMHSTKEHT
jgi:hypothetical protein